MKSARVCSLESVSVTRNFRQSSTYTHRQCNLDSAFGADFPQREENLLTNVSKYHWNRMTCLNQRKPMHDHIRFSDTDGSTTKSKNTNDFHLDLRKQILRRFRKLALQSPGVWISSGKSPMLWCNCCLIYWGTGSKQDVYHGHSSRHETALKLYFLAEGWNTRHKNLGFIFQTGKNSQKILRKILANEWPSWKMVYSDLKLYKLEISFTPKLNSRRSPWPALMWLIQADRSGSERILRILFS